MANKLEYMFNYISKDTNELLNKLGFKIEKINDIKHLKEMVKKHNELERIMRLNRKKGVLHNGK